MFGNTCQTNLNKNANKVAFRSVTFDPTGTPRRIFKEANDFFDRTKNARCPVISSKKLETFINVFKEIFSFLTKEKVNLSTLQLISCMFEYVKQRINLLFFLLLLKFIYFY